MTGPAGNKLSYRSDGPDARLPSLCVFKIVEDDLDFKAKIETILQESGFAEERAAKMDVDDLLK